MPDFQAEIEHCYDRRRIIQEEDHEFAAERFNQERARIDGETQVFTENDQPLVTYAGLGEYHAWVEGIIPGSTHDDGASIISPKITRGVSGLVLSYDRLVKPLYDSPGSPEANLIAKTLGISTVGDGK